MSGDLCQGPECKRPARWGSYCDSHYRQIKEGRPLKRLRPYHRWDDLKAYLLESAERFGRAEDAAAKAKAQHELMRAVRLYRHHSSVRRAACKEAA